MTASAVAIIAAIFMGASWRRWFGSARPSWAFPGYRATQVITGVPVLAGINALTGDVWWRAALDSGLAVGFMTLPIQYSRQPFLWLAERLNLPTTDNLQHPWRPMLQGPEPWAEVIQGATLWGLAVLV